MRSAVLLPSDRSVPLLQALLAMVRPELQSFVSEASISGVPKEILEILSIEQQHFAYALAKGECAMSALLPCAAALVGLYLLLRIITAPIRLGWKLLLNTFCGYAILLLLNVLSGVTGIVFAINAATAVIVGFLGLPGIALLLVLRWLL